MLYKKYWYIFKIFFSHGYFKGIAKWYDFNLSKQHDAKCDFDNVIFASNKNLLLGRVDTVHFTNSLFSNVILAGVSKSDVLQDCMEISKNDYDYSCLVSKASVNNGVLVE